MSQQLIIALVIAAYFAALMVISRFTGSKGDNSAFFIGGRKIAWPIAAMAMITAPISGVTFISVPGMVVHKGYSYLQMCLGFIVGYLLIAWVLVPIYYKHKIVSIYSFLEDRFGRETYKTGAWFFLISKILGTAVKFLVVCLVLQLLVFEPLHIPFLFNVIFTIALISLYTLNGGVRTVIWADLFKSICLVASTGLAIYFLSSRLGFSFPEAFSTISNHPGTKIFFFQNPSEATYFWKQFVAGIFLVVAMTGLDQDMMQHTLSCRNSKSSKKNLFVSSFLQCFVITLFLALGTLLVLYMERFSLEVPAKTDDIFAMVAFHDGMPIIVGILFILGLVAASYSSVGSALTSLTTSFTVDVMEAPKKTDSYEVSRIRKLVHVGIAAVLIIMICAFYYLNNQDAISAVFTLASYSYGPILGLFVFGIFTKKSVRPSALAVLCMAAPFLAWGVQFISGRYWGYEIGFELILINAAIIVLGASLLPSYKREKDVSGEILVSE